MDCYKFPAEITVQAEKYEGDNVNGLSPFGERISVPQTVFQNRCTSGDGA